MIKKHLCVYNLYLSLNKEDNRFRLSKTSPHGAMYEITFEELAEAIAESLSPWTGTVPEYLETTDSPFSGSYEGIGHLVSESLLHLIGWKKEIRKINLRPKPYAFDLQWINKKLMMIILFHIAGEETFMLSVINDTLSPLRKKFDSVFGKGKFDEMRNCLLFIRKDKKYHEQINFSIIEFTKILQNRPDKEEIVKGIITTARLLGYSLDPKWLDIKTYKEILKKTK